MTTLRGLTLHRPWAWAIAHSTKRVENRSWMPPKSVPNGTFIAIHAGKTFDAQAAEHIAAAITPACPRTSEGHATGIVAIAQLDRVIDCAREPIPEEQVPWTVGPYAWLLNNVVTLTEPIQCDGHQGLWVIEGGLLDRVRIAWRAARRTT